MHLNLSHSAGISLISINCPCLCTDSQQLPLTTTVCLSVCWEELTASCLFNRSFWVAGQSVSVPVEDPCVAGISLSASNVIAPGGSKLNSPLVCTLPFSLSPWNRGRRWSSVTCPPPYDLNHFLIIHITHHQTFWYYFVL